MNADKLTPESWLRIIKSAYTLFDDAEERGFGTPPFSLGGGTVLMLNFKHRLSKDIDLFGHDVQWISILSPRLNEKAANLATTYIEQANGVKIVMPYGDIDFVVAADITSPINRTKQSIAGREIEVEPSSEILAKKLFYRAAGFTARDVYDMSAAIDLVPHIAAKAARSATSKKDVLLRRFEELERIGEQSLLDGIVPYEGLLRHSRHMVEKVKDFVIKEIDDPNPADTFGKGRASDPVKKDKDERQR